MNARQRRGAVLLLVSALLALAAFAGVLAVVRDVRSKVGPEVTAYELAEDIRPYEELSPDQFREVSMPERYVPDTAVRDLAAIEGKVAVGPLLEGSLLQNDMISDRPDLSEGEMEIAIMIDASTGVAGKIYPGATINMYAAYSVDLPDEDGRLGGDGGEQEDIEIVRLMVNNARVIDVGDLTEVEEDREQVEVVPITFALTNLDAQRVAFAEAFAEQVRLALVAPGDERDIPREEWTYTIVGDILGNPHTDPLQFGGGSSE
ncbi:Flp pilus assembly protein CpaB [Streptomyces aidingensis]|uniref:Pilus assembly protein CpaB n=1 Tax=Streptomyces aidingensis TaxID=910347 RepID=A0A1I1EP03_9ACTN|nr:RcpC/CpaB family pilus assembly protein [Streptomyces aidingensis]SFB88382.1 pilus assembly protein CpaB [Streptomyces aidingensis]